jgi:hypothetical protein
MPQSSRGVQIEFISARVLPNKTSAHKVRIILGAVRENKIVVLESPLSRQEEADLITATMGSVTGKFPGIEISSLGEEAEGLRTAIIRMLGGKTAGLTIVGPSNLVRQVKRNPGRLNLFAGK